MVAILSRPQRVKPFPMEDKDRLLSNMVNTVAPDDLATQWTRASYSLVSPISPGISVPILNMMTSSNGNIFRVTGPLCGEFTGHRWIPHTKASDAELWCFPWSALWTNGWVNNREAGDLRRYRAHYVVIVMDKLTHIDGSVQDCSNSSALAMELLQSCTEPSVW